MSFKIYILGLLCCSLTKGDPSIDIDESCECGKSSAQNGVDVRIIGGTGAVPHSYPWLVYMTYYSMPYCGGGIINAKYILTAGHCIWNMDPEEMRVIVGAHEGNMNSGKGYEVLKTILHEHYIRYPSYDEYDLGLIKVVKSIKFSDNVLPICLPQHDDNFNDESVIVAGWGITEKGRLAKSLLETRVTVLSDEDCLKGQEKYVPVQHICAYAKGRDSCQGDSGSPIFLKENDDKYIVAGVVSFGEGCAPDDIPGVYVNVPHFLDWIIENTDDAKYCKK